MNDKIKGKVSYYKDANDTTSQSWVELDEVLSFIKCSPDKLINLTKELNILYTIDKDKYKQKKKQLPMICASGCFSYRNGNLSNLKAYSNVLILDFDWEYPDPAEIENFRQKLIAYATPLHIYAIWKSPAKGIKAAMIHNNRESAYHSELFNSIKDNLFSHTPQLDMTGRDIARACFLCNDSNLYINTDPNLEEFQFSHNPQFQPHHTKLCNPGVHSSDCQFKHTTQEILMNKGWQLSCSDKTLMNKIIKSCNAYNPDYYKDGNRHQEVLRRATLYCKDGVLYENAVTSIIGQFGDNSRAGLNNNDIESMINSCYHKARAEFGVERQTFIRKSKGQI